MKCPSCDSDTKVKRVYPEEDHVKERDHYCKQCDCTFMSRQIACPNILTLHIRV
jgi:hypothetical protein